MLGNEAIAAGLVENGCAVATSYPGTPASEILSSVAAWQKATGAPMHVEWGVNEKVSLEIAYTAAITGLRAAVAMKQVGLNVASDPFMSAAYQGVKGGFLVISADDPGPHSSQTEQDSRMMAMLAKVPVLDPESPAQAREMIGLGFELSEKFEIPVLIRPTTRVCHAGQDVPAVEFSPSAHSIDFVKEPSRWASTPKFRLRQHLQLVEKLERIAAHPPTAPQCLNPGITAPKAVVASGVAAAHAREIMSESGLIESLPLYRVLQPFPLHAEFRDRLLAKYEQILILEETSGVIELQFADRQRTKGKLTGFVPEAGELVPETVERLLKEFAGIPADSPVPVDTAGGRKPTLCPGCPHRASFYAIKKAAPHGIYPSDIGCYTLGLNLGAVDSVLCMGAAVSQAAGFFQAFKLAGTKTDIVATIGDSTFFHAGIPPLIDAVTQNARFVLVILDNSTTAMTGNQPTPALGIGAMAEPTVSVDMEGLVNACGIRFCQVADPTNLPEFIALLQKALAFSHGNGPAVVIARHPCIIDRRRKVEPLHRPVTVTPDCSGCRFCITAFECPALIFDEQDKRVRIDRLTCQDCGVCVHVCPVGAIRDDQTDGGK
jgi:indolepyruvate ferredoxin oxidoreductase alpha subunit